MKKLKEENKIKTKKKQEKGVTLIVLIIAIIVLLILVGIVVVILTGDNGILNKQTANGNVGTSTTGGETMGKTVEDLEVGDKVYYDTGNASIGENGLIECVVLYDTKYNQENGTNYGVQIISADIVEDDVALGVNDDFEASKDEYNNAITILNEKAEEYLNEKDKTGNPEIVTDARCVGSVPDNKNSEATDYFTSIYDYMSDYNNMFKNTDTNYETDYNQMCSEDLNIAYIGKSYWLASRMAISHEFTIFSIYAVAETESLYTNYTNLVNNNGHVRAVTSISGFRPVFTLKSGIKLTKGNGTDIPYTLET